MRPIPDAAPALVKRWEGCVLKAYPDPATGGDPWTIGWGHTGGVRPGQLINQAQADKFLMADLGIAAQRIWDRIGAVVEELTDNQYAALLSFVLNVGADPKWTIWKRLKARQFDQIPGELIKFVNANGRKMQGLVNRRTDEIRVWSTDEPGSENVNPSSNITRLVDTPPTPTDPTPPHKSATVWATVTAPFVAAFAYLHDWIIGAFVYVKDWITPDTVNHGIAAIQPYADKSPWVAGALQGLAVAGAALAAVLVLKSKSAARK